MNRCLTKKLGAAVLLCALAGSAFAEMGMYLKGGLGYTSRNMLIDTDKPNVSNGSGSPSYGGSGFPSYGGSGSSGVSDSSNLFPAIPAFVSSKLFGITAVFGIEPFLDSGNAFVRALSFEFSLDLAFGKGDLSGFPESVSAFAVTPGVMAVYSHRFDVGLKPYGGVGFSVPIQRVSGIKDTFQAFLDDLSNSYTNFDVDMEDSSIKVGFNVDVMAGLAYEVTEKIAPYIEFGLGFGSSFAFDVRGGVMYRLGGGSSSSSGGGDSASAPAGEAGE